MPSHAVVAWRRIGIASLFTVLIQASTTSEQQKLVRATCEFLFFLVFP